MRLHIYILTLLVTCSMVLPATAAAQTNTDDAEATENPFEEVIQNVRNLENATSTAQQVSGFSRDGVYGCTGSAYGAVGAQGPSGAHVPTFDNASFDQTRLLTYKECLLDGVYTNMRQTLVSSLIRSTVRWANTGFNGNPTYVEDTNLHLLERISDPTAERIITGAETDVLPGPFRRDVRVSLAKSYSQQTRSPEHVLRCSLPDSELEAFSQGALSGERYMRAYQAFLTEPACNPLFAYSTAENYLRQSISNAQQEELTQLQWGNGFRSLETTQDIDVGNGETVRLSRISTPGYLIAAQLSQTVGTGLRQAESADEIDEIISTLMANIGTEALAGQEGFSGLSRAINGQAPYIDRLAQDTASRTRGAMTGVASQTLNNALSIEEEYSNTWDSALATLQQARRQLQSWERTCWSQKVEEAKTAVRNEIRAQACNTQSDDDANTSCNISIVVTERLPEDELGYYSAGATSVVVEGQATRTDSRVTVTLSGDETELNPVEATLAASGMWATPSITLANLGDGTVTFSAQEIRNTSGTVNPVTISAQKKTSAGGVTLTPASVLPPITVSGSYNSYSAERTVTRSTNRSDAIIAQNITPGIELIAQNTTTSDRALQALQLIRTTLANTTSSSAQRYLLEQVDSLVSARLIHTDTQLRQAKTQAAELEGATEQLLEDTRESWEAGWCKPVATPTS